MNDRTMTRPAMTLREYYAGQALAGIMASPGEDFPDTLERAAHICVCIADALIVELGEEQDRG